MGLWLRMKDFRIRLVPLCHWSSWFMVVSTYQVRDFQSAVSVIYRNTQQVQARDYGLQLGCPSYGYLIYLDPDSELFLATARTLRHKPGLAEFIPYSPCVCVSRKLSLPIGHLDCSEQGLSFQPTRLNLTAMSCNPGSSR